MSLASLPKGPLSYLFSFLDNRSLGRMMSVCKNFNKVGQSETVQKVFARNLEPTIDLNGAKIGILLGFLKLNRKGNWSFSNDKTLAISGQFFVGNCLEIRKRSVLLNAGLAYYKLSSNVQLYVDNQHAYTSQNPETKVACAIAGNWRCITLLDDSYALVLHMKEKKKLSLLDQECFEQFGFKLHEYHLGLFDYVNLKVVWDLTLTDFEGTAKHWWGVSVEEGCVHFRF